MAKHDSDGIHLVPVFEKDLPAVWKLLSDLNVSPGAGAASGTPGVSVPDVQWSEADLAALHGMCKPVQRAILGRIAIAGAALKPATYEELRAAGAAASNAAAFSFDNLRGNLAWISKYGKKLKGKGAWPVQFSDQGAARPTGERYEYLMPKRLAELWLQIAAKA